MIFTDLNIEQSVAKYVADKFTLAGFKIYWWDTKQTVGAQPKQVTFVRDFPEDPAFIVHHDEVGSSDNLLRVPAFTVRSVMTPKAEAPDRMGIGESAFDWRSQVRIEGFADNEKQWYDFMALFQTWLMHPDVRVDLADYQSNLAATPTPVEEKIMFEDKDLRKVELGNGPDAARYFIQFAATARFIE